MNLLLVIVLSAIPVLAGLGIFRSIFKNVKSSITNMVVGNLPLIAGGTGNGNSGSRIKPSMVGPMDNPETMMQGMPKDGAGTAALAMAMLNRRELNKKGLNKNLETNISNNVGTKVPMRTDMESMTGFANMNETMSQRGNVRNKMRTIKNVMPQTGMIYNNAGMLKGAQQNAGTIINQVNNGNLNTNAKSSINNKIDGKKALNNGINDNSLYNIENGARKVVGARGTTKSNNKNDDNKNDEMKSAKGMQIQGENVKLFAQNGIKIAKSVNEMPNDINVGEGDNKLKLKIKAPNTLVRSPEGTIQKVGVGKTIEGTLQARNANLPNGVKSVQGIQIYGGNTKFDNLNGVREIHAIHGNAKFFAPKGTARLLAQNGNTRLILQNGNTRVVSQNGNTRVVSQNGIERIRVINGVSNYENVRNIGKNESSNGRYNYGEDKRKTNFIIPQTLVRTSQGIAPGTVWEAAKQRRTRDAVNVKVVLNAPKGTAEQLASQISPEAIEGRVRMILRGYRRSHPTNNIGLSVNDVYMPIVNEVTAEVKNQSQDLDSGKNIHYSVVESGGLQPLINVYTDARNADLDSKQKAKLYTLTRMAENAETTNTDAGKYTKDRERAELEEWLGSSIRVLPDLDVRVQKNIVEKARELDKAKTYDERKTLERLANNKVDVNRANAETLDDLLKKNKNVTDSFNAYIQENFDDANTLTNAQKIEVERIAQERVKQRKEMLSKEKKKSFEGEKNKILEEERKDLTKRKLDENRKDIEEIVRKQILDNPDGAKYIIGEEGEKLLKQAINENQRKRDNEYIKLLNKEEMKKDKNFVEEHSEYQDSRLDDVRVERRRKDKEEQLVEAAKQMGYADSVSNRSADSSTYINARRNGITTHVKGKSTVKKPITYEKERNSAKDKSAHYVDENSPIYNSPTRPVRKKRNQKK